MRLSAQAEATAARVLEEYRTSGTLPGSLIRMIQGQIWMNGRIDRAASRLPTAEEVEASVRKWADELLERDDKRRAAAAEKQRRKATGE